LGERARARTRGRARSIFSLRSHQHGQQAQGWRRTLRQGKLKQWHLLLWHSGRGQGFAVQREGGKRAFGWCSGRRPRCLRAALHCRDRRRPQERPARVRAPGRDERVYLLCRAQGRPQGVKGGVELCVRVCVRRNGVMAVSVTKKRARGPAPFLSLASLSSLSSSLCLSPPPPSRSPGGGRACVPGSGTGSLCGVWRGARQEHGTEAKE